MAQALANVIEITARNKPAAATMSVRTVEFLQVDERPIGERDRCQKMGPAIRQEIFFKADFLLEP